MMRHLRFCLFVAAALTAFGIQPARGQTSMPIDGYVVLKNGASTPVFLEAGHAGNNPDFTNTVASIVHGGSLRFGGEVKTTVTSVPYNGSTEVRADEAQIYYSIDGGSYTMLSLPFQFANGGSYDQWQAADGGNGGATVEIGTTLPVGLHTLAVYYEAVDNNFPLGGPIITSLGSTGQPFMATIQVLAPPAIAVDGTAEAGYGPARASQEWGTTFGNNTDASIAVANGSELDTAFALVQDGWLFLFFGGNLESNGNQLEIFIDSKPGGQNRLLNNSANINNFLNMADDGSGNGLRFSTGFEADYWFGFNGNGGTWYTDYLEIGTPNGYFVGLTSPASSGQLAGGINPHGIRGTINNSNTGGIGESVCPTGNQGCHASTSPEVRTGIELAIPLAAMGNPTGSMKIFAIINGPAHDFLSNQMLRAPVPCNPVPNQPPYVPSLGNPRSVSLNSYECGSKWFEVTVPPAVFPISTLTGDPQSPAGLTLTWSSFGADYRYTVEICDSIGGTWQPAAGTSWPITGTSWTDTSSSATSNRLYRVRASIQSP